MSRCRPDPQDLRNGKLSRHQNDDQEQRTKQRRLHQRKGDVAEDAVHIAAVDRGRFLQIGVDQGQRAVQEDEGIRRIVRTVDDHDARRKLRVECERRNAETVEHDTDVAATAGAEQRPAYRSHQQRNEERHHPGKVNQRLTGNVGARRKGHAMPQPKNIANAAPPSDTIDGLTARHSQVRATTARDNSRARQLTSVLPENGSAVTSDA